MIAFCFLGFGGKLVAGVIEEIDPSAVKAIESTGASQS
jgi:ABC-type phosphate/phosphonate transport system permease subunit